MSEPLVSIIMPVYQVEAYVARAIESILKQSYVHFEFFIVNDGSPDNSDEICLRYSRKDPRIRYLSQRNCGAFAARNHAIDLAQGKYLYFMDSDDWAEMHMLRDMVAVAEETQSEYVVSGYYIDTYYTEEKFITQNVCGERAFFETRQDFRDAAAMLLDHGLMYAPWNKLFLRSRVEELGLRFPATRMDDFPFNLGYMRDVSRVAVMPEAYYHFQRARSDSETARYMPSMYEKREEEHIWLEEIFAYWQLNDAASREFLARRYCERALGCIENLMRAPKEVRYAQRLAETKQILQNERLVRLLKTARPRTRMLKLMFIPMKWRAARLCMLECRIIALARSRFTRLFATLKAQR